MTKRCAIIGGGIGGLTAALCLAERGWMIDVFEQAEAFSDVGAGIQLSPNAMAIYAALDPQLALRIQAAAIAPAGLEMRDGLTGRGIFKVDLQAPDGKRSYAVERWGQPYVNIFRPRLVEILADELAAKRAVSLKLAAEVNLDQFDTLTRIYDLVVVANGLHSQIVQQRFRAQPPALSGHIAYRAVVQGGNRVPRTSCVYLGVDRHAVTYPVMTSGGPASNIVAIIEASRTAAATVGTGWQTDDARQAALAAFQGFASPIGSLLDSAEIVRPWALYHRAPLRAWHTRNAVLVGDAAHPMLPTFAQGAAMSIEDAWVLAQQVSGLHPLNKALGRYTAFRLPRVVMIYHQAKRNLRLFHRKGWLSRRLALASARIAASLQPNIILSRFDAVYGVDVTSDD